MNDAAPPLRARLSDVSRAVGRLSRKTERRLAAITADLEAIDAAEAWAARAPWLVAAAAKAPRGATALLVRDWSSGEETELSFPLDPSKAARAQVDAVFDEARRLRRGRPKVEARLRTARDELRALERAAADLDLLAALLDDPTADVTAIAESLAETEASLAPLARARTGGGLTEKRGDAPRRLPYRTFVLESGIRVLVGRDARGNDELTLHVAKPHHVWLHAKGYPGSHVVACIDKGHTLSADALVDCAHLAAHFSEARGEALVEVSYMPRRYLRKPRKSPPGAVVLDREKVLTLRVEPSRLAKLLTGEEARLPGDGPRSEEP